MTKRSLAALAASLMISAGVAGTLVAPQAAFAQRRQVGS